MSCDPAHLGPALKEVGVPGPQLQAGAQQGVSAAVQRARRLEYAQEAEAHAADVTDATDALRAGGLAQQGDCLAMSLNRLTKSDLPNLPEPPAGGASTDTMLAYVRAMRAHGKIMHKALDNLGVRPGPTLAARAPDLVRALQKHQRTAANQTRRTGTA